MSEHNYITHLYQSTEDEQGASNLSCSIEVPESGKRRAFRDSQSLWSKLIGCTKLGESREYLAIADTGIATEHVMCKSPVSD